jgi:hypothetical protein
MVITGMSAFRQQEERFVYGAPNKACKSWSYYSNVSVCEGDRGVDGIARHAAHLARWVRGEDALG